MCRIVVLVLSMVMLRTESDTSFSEQLLPTLGWCNKASQNGDVLSRFCTVFAQYQSSETQRNNRNVLHGKQGPHCIVPTFAIEELCKNSQD